MSNLPVASLLIICLQVALVPAVLANIDENLLAIGVLDTHLYLITRELQVFRVSKDTLPDRIVSGESRSALDYEWPDLAKKDIDKCALGAHHQPCKLWFYSEAADPAMDSLFYTVKNTRRTVRYQVTPPKVTAMPFDPYAGGTPVGGNPGSPSVMLSADQEEKGAVYRVSVQYGGLLFESFPLLGPGANGQDDNSPESAGHNQTTPTSMAAQVSDSSRVLCIYPMDSRVQFSVSLFVTHCGVPIQWAPRTGFVADHVFYIFGNDSNVYIFDTRGEPGILGEDEYVLRTVSYYDFVTVSFLSTTAKVLIITAVFIVVALIFCCLFCFFKHHRKPIKVLGGKFKPGEMAVDGKVMNKKKKSSARNKKSGRKTGGSKRSKRRTKSKRSSLKKRSSRLGKRKSSKRKKSSVRSKRKSSGLGKRSKRSGLGKRSKRSLKRSSLKKSSIKKSSKLGRPTRRSGMTKRSASKHSSKRLTTALGGSRASKRGSKASAKRTAGPTNRTLGASNVLTKRRSTLKTSRRSGAKRSSVR